MVQLAEISATLQRLDELSDTLERGIEHYEHNVGVLRGQVQSLGTRLHRYMAVGGGGGEGGGDSDTDLSFLNKLVSKVAGRFNKVLHWQARPGVPFPSAPVARRTPVSSPSTPTTARQRSGSRSAPSSPAAGNPGSDGQDPGEKGGGAGRGERPHDDSNSSCTGGGGGSSAAAAVLSYEQRLAENEQALQAKLLGLEPEDMWAEIAQMWAKITWARGLFKHLPAQEVLATAKDQQLGPPPGGVAKALLVSNSSGSGTSDTGCATGASGSGGTPPGSTAAATAADGANRGDSAPTAAAAAVDSVEERLARCGTAAAFEQVLLSLQPEEMWDNVGAIYRELQWCTVVVTHLPDAALKGAMDQGAIGPPPPGFFPVMRIPTAAAAAPVAGVGNTAAVGGSEGLDPQELVGESFRGGTHDRSAGTVAQRGSGGGGGAGVSATTAVAVEAEVAAVDVGIAVADELSIGNCHIVCEFMQAYQHLPDYQLHCLRVLRSLMDTPVAGAAPTSLPSALSQAAAAVDDCGGGRGAGGEGGGGGAESGLARARAHPDSWVCATCAYRSRGERRGGDSGGGGGAGCPGAARTGTGAATAVAAAAAAASSTGRETGGSGGDAGGVVALTDAGLQTCECELCGVEFYASEVSVEPVSVEEFEAAVSDRTMQQRLVRLDAVDLVLYAMRTYPKHKGIQREGCLTLLQLTANSTDADAILRIAARGGIQCVLDTMHVMRRDVVTQLAAFGLLASPLLIDNMVARVGMADYLSAVMAAMKSHPRNPQIQGLGYLAMANLALRDDRHVGDITIAGGIEVVLDSLAHMEEEANVQAAGFWALSALTRWVADGYHREAREVIQQSGRAGSFLKAVRRFPKQKKLREHAERLIDNLLDKDEPQRGRAPTGGKDGPLLGRQQHWASPAHAGGQSGGGSGGTGSSSVGGGSDTNNCAIQ